MFRKIEHVEHNRDSGMFCSPSEPNNAYLSYKIKKGHILDLTETFVPEGKKGDSIAKSLIETALDYAKNNDYRIIPTCPFVKTYIQRNMHNINLVADGHYSGF